MGCVGGAVGGRELGCHKVVIGQVDRIEIAHSAHSLSIPEMGVTRALSRGVSEVIVQACGPTYRMG